MRVSLKTAGALTAALCISLWLIGSASLIAQWLAPALLILAMLLAICFAAGGNARSRSFTLAFLGVILTLWLTDWSKAPLPEWRIAFERYTYYPLRSQIHSADGLTYYRRDYRGGDRIVERTADGRPIFHTMQEAKEAGINVDAVPRVPTSAEFRVVFYSTLYLWLGVLAGFLALAIHRRVHRTASDVEPVSAD